MSAPADARTRRPIASLIVPAHDEAAVIARLLGALVDDDVPLEIVVVANGCSDDTVAVASSIHPDIRVIEIPEPSKRIALARGDDAATTFPRIYVDADVEIAPVSVERLVRALAADGVHAAAPERFVPQSGASWAVRWYHDVWQRLPSVRAGLFGRGVIALSEVGNARVRELPAVMGDDLAASDAFGPTERVVVSDSFVTVWPPRRLRDLIRRRVRIVTGNAQADRLAVRRSDSVTTPLTLIQLIRDEPILILRMPVFLGVTIACRVLARRAIRSGDTETWLRDESSRTAPHV